MKNTYGHWTTKLTFDPMDYASFVYLMVCNETKHRYIGVKMLWIACRTAPNIKWKTAKKRSAVKASDWKKYTSSSKYVNNMIKDGHTFTYEILSVHDTFEKGCYEETRLHFELDVIHNDIYLNKCAGGRQFRK